LEKTIESAPEQLKKLKEWLEEPCDEVIFTGCGSTHYLSLAAAKTWTFPDRSFCPGVFQVLRSGITPKYTFADLKPKLVAISRSGETTETINALEVFKQKPHRIA